MAKDDNDDSNVTRVLLQDLVARPARYEGKRIEVIGIYIFSLPRSFIVSRAEDYVSFDGSDLNNQKVALEIGKYRAKIGDDARMAESKYGYLADGVVVKVRGKFFNQQSHGMWVALVIDDIQEFVACNDSEVRC
ncbi:hypothetical protein LK540_21085 [Massilia sp. IC2-278]|uniref:hypothetical protein n=1 Tax=Massilia sp. IC2-278 TaxID=2887200 RepID=UPI001E4438ED|nr:hypothetical protein [Massilia sp. IC2-278]MCC2962932.1 hypothetical protein [Massilia sp. IC2-278]